MAALMLAGVFGTVTACDRWKAPFRVSRPEDMRRAAALTPLPESGFRVVWETHSVPTVMAPGSVADVRVAFTNRSDAVWPDNLAGDPSRRDGAHAVRLAYGWSAASEPRLATPGGRADLPQPIRPGETMTLLVPIEAPTQPGEYRLTFGLVQEFVAWFADRGAPVLVVPVSVR